MNPKIKTALKWIVLCAVGFGLGAVAALTQQSPAPVSQKPAATAAVTPDGMLANPKKEADGTDAAAGTKDQPQESAAAAAPAGSAAGTGAEDTDITSPSSDFKVLNDQKHAEEAAKNPPPEPSAPAPMKPLVSGVSGAFTLTDHDGKPVTEKSWPGKYQIVFFGFTHCPDICPVTLDKLASVMNKLGDDADKVQPLFITVDPDRDTPAVMKAYVGNFGKSFLGLTGSKKEIAAAEDAFKVYASQSGGQNNTPVTFDHSAYVYFMTPDNQLAEIITAQDKAGEIADKIKPYLTGEKKVDPATAP